MACFTDFYVEVAQIRQAVAKGRLAAYLAEGKPISFGSASAIAAAVAERLSSRLQQQAKLVRQGGNEAEIKAYRQAQFVMAALADEVLLLDLDWSGSGAWSGELLERRLFGTSSAGRDFFKLLDSLLQLRGRSRLLTELGSIYLLALQLGFKGRYRSRAGEGVIARYRSRLLRFIGWGDRSADDDLMFPHAYQHLIRDMSGQRLAPLSRWLMIISGVLLVYLLASSVVWLVVTQRFDKLFGIG